ncbi:MAG: hypothetical protein OEW35_09825 [Gammaproteobacteria bacterium]|nr:hypothetical protein [Gammaproteobacteria bacterium]MDH4253663.1 hypothetical protein [Gammaproteobacteria bacterium]MDH5309779.1 hypothetical protein [Gammaproteobacteria bacterium]
MSKLPAIVAGLCIVLLARPAPGDDLLPDTSDIRHSEHRTSPYPSRWCIEHFIAATRAGRPIRIRSTTYIQAASPVLNEFETPALVHDNSRWQGTLLGRIIEHRSLRLATLWTGRDSALYFGVDDSGILGVSLGEREDLAGR